MGCLPRLTQDREGQEDADQGREPGSGAAERDGGQNHGFYCAFGEGPHKGSGPSTKKFHEKRESTPLVF
jgi:hypothetical protein